MKHILTLASLATLFLAADGESSSSSPSPDVDSRGKDTSNKPVADPNDPNQVIGGPKKEAEQIDLNDRESIIVPPPVEPRESAGHACFDRSSQRETEIFDSGDVVFVREGSATHLTAYPSHEAETRFVNIDKRESKFRSSDGKTVTALELEGGDKVTIEGTTVIVTPAEGAATTEGPSLNAKAPNEAH